MTSLNNFPMVSQLTAETSDGQPSENKQLDCVAASIGAAILYYQKKTQWDSQVNPDRLKDAAVGQGTTGGTAAVNYIPFCRQLGYNITPLSGDAANLIVWTHEQIKNGVPVVFTEPDPYVSSALGWSHVCVFYAEDSGSLTAMDPYIAKSIKRSNAEWQALLMFNQIWLVQSLGETLTYLQIGAGMGAHYTAASDTHWRCNQTGVDLIDGHLDFYRKHEGIFGLALTNETRLSTMPDAPIVIYERAIAIYDPSHKYDDPTGSGQVYLVHIDSGVGQQIIAKPLLVALQQQVTTLTNQLQQASQAGQSTAQAQALQTQINAYHQAFNTIQTALQQAAAYANGSNK